MKQLGLAGHPLPLGWLSVPAGSLFHREKRTNFPGEELLSVYRDHGVVPKNSRDDNFNKASEDLSAYQLVEPNDLVINKMKAWQGSVGVSNHRGIVSPAYFVASPKRPFSRRYVHYLLRCSDYLVEYQTRSGGIRVNQWDLDWDDFRRIPVTLPPHDDQERIANFLDDKTARIDALIAEKEQLAESLAEFMASQLEAAFTGVDDVGPKKKTGSIFFPELPVLWQPSALKHLLSTPVADGPHETPEFFQEGVPFVSAEAIKRGLVDFDRKRGYITPELHATYCQKIKPQRDDIFMVKSGNTTGALAIVETDEEFSVWSPLAVLRAERSKIHPRFLYLAMQAPYFQRSVQLYWSYGTQPNIGMAVIENLQVAVPPVQEQQAIVERMGLLRERVEGLTSHCIEHIARLREYRSSLISAAVTGQVDISTFKPAAAEEALEAGIA